MQRTGVGRETASLTWQMRCRHLRRGPPASPTLFGHMLAQSRHSISATSRMRRHFRQGCHLSFFNPTLCASRKGNLPKTTQVRRNVISLRSITLMQTSGEIIATVANEELSEVASRIVAGDHRGFIKGRNMADNIIEFEGSADAYSQLHLRTSAGMLLDFVQALPSLAHAWMWAGIAKLPVNPKLQNLLHSLYTELTTIMFYDNLELGAMHIKAGIRQVVRSAAPSLPFRSTHW